MNLNFKCNFPHSSLLALVVSPYILMFGKLRSYYCKEYLFPFNGVQIEVVYSLKYVKCHDALGWFSIVCGAVHLLPSFDCTVKIFQQGYVSSLLGGDRLDDSLLLVKSVLACSVQAAEG